MAITQPGEMPPTPDVEKPDNKSAETQTPEQLQVQVAELQKALKERNREEAARRKKLEEAESKALEEQQQYQKLAEKQKTRIAELETQTTEVDGLRESLKAANAALEASVKAQKAELPPAVAKLLEQLPPAEQLAWLAENRESVTRVKPEPVKPTPKTGEPGGPTLEDLVTRKRTNPLYSSGL